MPKNVFAFQRVVRNEGLRPAAIEHAIGAFCFSSFTHRLDILAECFDRITSSSKTEQSA